MPPSPAWPTMLKWAPADTNQPGGHKLLPPLQDPPQPGAPPPTWAPTILPVFLIGLHTTESSSSVLFWCSCLKESLKVHALRCKGSLRSPKWMIFWRFYCKFYYRFLFHIWRLCLTMNKLNVNSPPKFAVYFKGCLEKFRKYLFIFPKVKPLMYSSGISHVHRININLGQ